MARDLSTIQSEISDKEDKKDELEKKHKALDKLIEKLEEKSSEISDKLLYEENIIETYELLLGDDFSGGTAVSEFERIVIEKKENHITTYEEIYNGFDSLNDKIVKLNMIFEDIAEEISSLEADLDVLYAEEKEAKEEAREEAGVWGTLLQPSLWW